MKQKIVDLLVILYSVGVALTYLFVTMLIGTFYFIKDIFSKNK